MLRINRVQWLHGEGSGRSFLLRESDGKMCCLGFAAIQLCGLEPGDIVLTRQPKDITRYIDDAGQILLEPVPIGGKMSGAFRQHLPWLFKAPWNNSEDAESLMSINDDSLPSGEAREEIIAQIFSRHGVRVEFYTEEEKKSDDTQKVS